MKQYIAPKTSVIILNSEELLLVNSLELSTQSVDGSSALAKRHGIADIWDDEEEE